MPSIKPVIKKNVINSDNKANIKIRISHNRKVRYFKTPWYIEPKYIGSDGLIKTSYPGHISLNGSLMRQVHEYNNIIASIGPDIIYMDINTLVNKLRVQTTHGSSFSSYMKHRIKELEKEGRFSYAESYGGTLKHLTNYTHREEIRFNEITVSFLKDFERYLRHDLSLRINSTRIYLNNIRAVFYHALDAEIIKVAVSPFRKFKISQEKTRPRPVNLTDLRRMLQAQPYLTGAEQRAIDIFFLIFYLGGINLKDLLYLKKGDLYKGRIIYKRFKTGREYSVKVFPEAMEIFERYPGKKYLLSFIEEKMAITPSSRKGYEHKDLLRNTNKFLKIAGKDCGIELPITTYVARYSFATIASKIGIPKDIIAQILGHGLNTMTDLYIDFDQEKVDEAIQTVINLLKKF